jgi:hypothetical protein
VNKRDNIDFDLRLVFVHMLLYEQSIYIDKVVYTCILDIYMYLSFFLRIF